MFQSFEHHQEIIELLQSHKQIHLTKSLSYNNNHTSFIALGNSSTLRYTIIIDSIEGLQSYQKSNKIKKLQETIVNLRTCNHRNILKYFDSFIIQNYHFILLESVQISLYDLALQHCGSDSFNQLFVKIAIQLLSGLDYLHSQNLFLHIPTLKSIFVDENMNVKFLYFKTQQSLDKSEFSATLSYFDYYKLPYIPPEDFIQENDKQEIYYQENLTVEGNIWSICMCLYELAGAKYLQQKQFLLGIDSYRIQYQIHYRINLILQQALKRDIQQRPKLNSLMSIFQQVQQSLYVVKEFQEQEMENEIFIEAQKFFDNQKYSEALNILFKLLQNNLDCDKYIAWIGRCYCAINQLDKAEYWSSQSLKINPNNDVSYFNLGNIWKMRKDFEKAIHFFKKSIDCNPKNIYSMNNLALIYDSLSMEDKAQDIYLTAIEIQPEKQFLYYNIGRSFYLQNNYDEAKKWFLKTLEIDSTYYKSLTYLGEIEFIKNNSKEAMVYFQKSLKASPNENTFFSLGTQYYKNGKYTFSLVCFQQAQKKLKSHSLQYILASTYYCKQKYDKSIRIYKTALEQKPNDQNSQTFIRLSKRFI
ncbi:hypothetical protein ABPG72_004847 [Tetrahymena utriculariae]